MPKCHNIFSPSEQVVVPPVNLLLQGKGRAVDMLPMQTGAKHAGMVYYAAGGDERRGCLFWPATDDLRPWMLQAMQENWYGALTARSKGIVTNSSALIDVAIQPYEQAASWLSDVEYQSGFTSPTSSDGNRSWRLSDGSLSASPTSSNASSVYGSYENCSKISKKAKSSRLRK